MKTKIVLLIYISLLTPFFMSSQKSLSSGTITHKKERYITFLINGHLLDLHTEAGVLANGYNLGEMDALLLQKIQELTLFIIEQQKEIDKLNRKSE